MTQTWVGGRGIVGSSDLTNLAAIADGKTFTSTDFGMTWTEGTSIEDVLCLASSSDGTSFAAANNPGTIWLSTYAPPSSPPSTPVPAPPPVDLPPSNGLNRAQPPEVEVTHEVVLTATVAGAVADFSDEVIDSIEHKVALELDVSKGNVLVEVEAASVVLTITVGFTDAASATTGHSTLTELTSTNDAASDLLSTTELEVTVESVEVAEPVAAISTDDGEDGGWVGGVVGGAVGGVAVLVAVAGVTIWQRRRKRKQTELKA